MLKSPASLEAQRVLEKAAAGELLMQDEFCAARDLLIPAVNSMNGSGPGPIQHLTMAAYSCAEVVENVRVALIGRNKCAVQGPAKLVFDETTQRMDVYVTHIRPQFALPSETALFVKFTGERFENDIGKRITAFWTEARPDMTVTATHVRKMVSTAVHFTDPEGQETMSARRLMSHTKKSALMNYVRQDVAQDAKAGFDAMRQAMCDAATTVTTAAAAAATSASATSTAATSAAKTSTNASPGLPERHSCWFCRHAAQRGISPSRQNVKAKLLSIKHLAHLAASPATVAEVLAFLERNAEQRRQHHLRREDAPTRSNASSNSAPRSSSPSAPVIRRRWSKQDSAAIMDGLDDRMSLSRDHIYMRKDDVEFFQESRELREMYTREAFSSCYEKVKSTIKKLMSNRD